MLVTRRALMKLCGGAAAAYVGLDAAKPASSSGARLALRRVVPADAAALQTIMNTCVVGAGAFHGECSEWALDWATGFVTRRPDAVVLALDGLPVAFLEVESIEDAPPPLPSDATEAERSTFALREQNRTTLRITAGGVRADRLAPAEAVMMFRRVLYYGFRAAVGQGFVYGECRVPWEQHPKFARKWTDYPSCELVEAPSRAQGSGRDVYWLRWRLADFITALAAEGAGEEQLDVA